MGHSVWRRLAVSGLAFGLATGAIACSSGSGSKVSLGTAGGGVHAGTTVGPATTGAGTQTAAGAPPAAGVQPPGSAVPTTSHPATTAAGGHSTPNPSATAPKATVPGATGPAPTAPGTYHYQVSGTSVLTTGTTATTLAVAPTSTLVVTSTGSGGQQWVGSTTTSNLVFSGAGVFLTSETVPLVGATCTFTTPMASPPWPVGVGKSFSGQATCGSGSSAATLTIQGRVSGTGSVSVGGTSVNAYLIQTTLTLSGTTLAVAETDWYAPSLRLPVKSIVLVQGGIPGYTIASNTTYTLTSSVPS